MLCLRREALSAYEESGQGDLEKKKLIELAKKNKNLNGELFLYFTQRLSSMRRGTSFAPAPERHESHAVRMCAVQLERERTEATKAKNELARMKADQGKSPGKDAAAEAGAWKKKHDDAVSRLGQLQLEVSKTKDRVRARSRQDAVQDRESKELLFFLHVSLHMSMRVHVVPCPPQVAKLEQLLKQELGPDADIDKLVREGGADRTGRVQELELLRAQVRELRQKVGEAGRTREERTIQQQQKENRLKEQKVRADGGMDWDALCWCCTSLYPTRAPMLSRVQEKEELQTKVQLLEAELKTATEKSAASAGRARTVSRQIQDLKEKLQVVLEKTANDDKYIAALQGQLRRMRVAGGDVSGGAEEDAEVAHLHGVVQEREQQIDRQEKIIKALQAQMQDLQIQLHQGRRGEAGLQSEPSARSGGAEVSQGGSQGRAWEEAEAGEGAGAVAGAGVNEGARAWHALRQGSMRAAVDASLDDSGLDAPPDVPDDMTGGGYED